MWTRSIRTFLTGLLTAAIAGCHPPAIDAPSLAPRPVERRPIETPDPASEPATVVDPALIARIGALVADAEAGHARFQTELRRVAKAIEAGAMAREGSEAWIQAQQAQSGLEAAQGPVRDAASAIEALREEPANFGPGERAAIDTAATKVAALAAEEAEAVTKTRPR